MILFCDHSTTCQSLLVDLGGQVADGYTRRPKIVRPFAVDCECHGKRDRVARHTVSHGIGVSDHGEHCAQRDPAHDSQRSFHRSTDALSAC